VFLYGNYDGEASSPSFDVHLGSNYWDTFENTDYWWSEAIFIAWASWVPVCLLNTGSGTPFVNTVELRRLQASLYPQLVTPHHSIYTYTRGSMGANTTTRFPSDPFDRLWWSMNSSLWTSLSTEETIQQDYDFAVPIAVLKTAVAPVNNNAVTVLTDLSSESHRTSFQFMVVLHFADFQNSQLRQFIVYINEVQLYNITPEYSPAYLTASSVYTDWIKATDSKLNVTLAATNISLPPR